MANTVKLSRKDKKAKEGYNKLSPQHRKETLVSYLFLAPALVFFVIFVIVPIFNGVFTSFFHYERSTFEFSGLDNYIRLFGDPIFYKSLLNTIVLVIASVPIIVLFSLFVSAVIYQKNSFVRSAFRGIFYLPVVTGSVAVTVVWRWIFDPYNGVLNYVLQTYFGVEDSIQWLGDKRYALVAIIIILITTSVGQPIILYIASLGNLDTSHIEAAEIDGASSWQVFKHIKWPGIMPTTLYVVVITTINTFQCFALVKLLTNGGPNYSTSTLMYQVYETAFKNQDFGYANAIGVILALVIGLFSWIQFKFFGNDVDY